MMVAAAERKGVAFSTFRHNRHSLCGEDRQGAVADQRAYVLLLDQLDYTPHLRAGTVPAARRFLPQCLGLLQQELQGLMQGLVPHARNSLPFASLAADGKPPQAAAIKQAIGSHDQDLQELFNEFDTNNEGYVNAHKLQIALSKLALPCGRDFVEQLMKQYDYDRDGKITFPEFCQYVGDRQNLMARAFHQLDSDTNGQHLGAIDTETLVRVLRKAGLPAEKEDALHMINLLDKDHDGKICYREFCRFACLLPAAQVAHNNILFDWADSADWLQHMEYRLSMIPPKSSYERLIAGGVAGAVSRSVVAPFERLRTIMMTSSLSLAEACQNVLSEQGILGFWRGNTITVLKTIPQSAIQFTVYDGTKDFLTAAFPRRNKEGLTQIEHVFAGCVAGAAAILSTYPLETLRTRMSIAGGSVSITRGIQQIWQHQGISGFYQGLKCGILCEMLNTGLGFWAYEMGQGLFRDLHEGRSPSPRERGFIGGFSAMLVMSTTMPLETVLRRLQVQGHPGKPLLYRNARHCLSTILQAEGFPALYRGLASSFMKVGPSIGATYAIYALLVQKWGIGGIRGFSHLAQDDEAALAGGQIGSGAT